MANEKRLIDAKHFDLRVANVKMTEIFPNWKELPEETRDAVCKHGQYLHMMLETQPTVDAVEVVHGEWGEIYTCHGERLWGYKCSRCEQDNPNKSNYCPNCGAKMDGDGNG